MYAIVFYIVCLLVLQIASHDVSVRVKDGEIVGLSEATVFEGKRYFAFYGIPYARPPINKLRFKDPRPPKKWGAQALDARRVYHGACAQAHIVHSHSQFGNENCLYLNIFTPFLPTNDSDILKPVVVWIHGYAFTSSFSHIYGADFLVDNDVLFVTVTHRIGVFGFMKVNESDSNVNMGLKDMVMALTWIKSNIKKFGGNRKEVTLMASGSAASLSSWLLMTKYRKLFSKIILQSGAFFSPPLVDRNYKFEIKRIKEELKKVGVKKLGKASTKDIITAARKVYNTNDFINHQRPLVPFVPIKEIDSNISLVNMRPEEFFKSYKNKKFTKIPILIGFNSQESIAEVIPFLHNPHFVKLFRSAFKFTVPFSDGCRYKYGSEKYKEIAAKIYNEYFNGETDDKPIETILKYVSDLHKYPIFKTIKALLNVNKGKTFVYKFNYVGEFNAIKANSIAGADIKVKGAASGDENCYILRCEPIWENYMNLKDNTSNKDFLFIKQIAAWWANFAKTGDPTPESYSGNLQWPAMTLQKDNIMLIGQKSQIIRTAPEEKTYMFWNQIYDSYYSDNCKEGFHDEL